MLNKHFTWKNLLLSAFVAAAWLIAKPFVAAQEFSVTDPVETIVEGPAPDNSFEANLALIGDPIQQDVTVSSPFDKSFESGLIDGPPAPIDGSSATGPNVWITPSLKPLLNIPANATVVSAKCEGDPGDPTVGKVCFSDGQCLPIENIQVRARPRGDTGDFPRDGVLRNIFAGDWINSEAFANQWGIRITDWWGILSLPNGNAYPPVKIHDSRDFQMEVPSSGNNDPTVLKGRCGPITTRETDESLSIFDAARIFTQSQTGQQKCKADSECGTKNGVPRYCDAQGTCQDPHCTQADYQNRKTEADALCSVMGDRNNPLPNCSSQNKCEDNLDLLDKWQRCLTATKRVNDVCFGGESRTWTQLANDRESRKTVCELFNNVLCSIEGNTNTTAPECWDTRGAPYPVGSYFQSCINTSLSRQDLCEQFAKPLSKSDLVNWNILHFKSPRDPVPGPENQRRSQAPWLCNDPSKMQVLPDCKGGGNCKFPSVSGARLGYSATAKDTRVTISFYQSLWRGENGWMRRVPMDSAGQPLWGSAPTTWQGPYGISSLPGDGPVQALNLVPVPGVVNYVYQSLVRGNQYWWRYIPLSNTGEPDFARAFGWEGRVSLSLLLPSSGTIQAFSEVLLPNGKLSQSVWINGQGWLRLIPFVQGIPGLINGAEPWRGPYALNQLPGTGDMRSQTEIVLPNNLLLQTIWRDQGWQRTAPIENGVPNFGKVSPWVGATYANALPGSGAPVLNSYAVRPQPQTWVFRTIMKCSNPNARLSPPTNPIIYQYGNWAPPNPIIWRQGQATTGTEIRIAQQTPGNTHLIFRPVDMRFGYEWLEPTKITAKTTGANASYITKGQYLNPPTLMLRWAAHQLPGGTYEVELNADRWCVSP